MKRHVFPIAAVLALTAVSVAAALACEAHGETQTNTSISEKRVVHLAASSQSMAAEMDAPVMVGDLEISQGWFRATLPGQPAAGGFLIIDNKGKETDRLLSVSSPLTPSVQIHVMKMDGDVMKMAELPEGLEIPAGAKVEMKPGGLHLMFLGLKKQVSQGETVQVTLTFEKAGAVDVALPVQPADAKEMKHQRGG